MINILLINLYGCLIIGDRIYQWLAAPDASDNYEAARELHHTQTGGWFVEGKEFQIWKKTPDSAFWLQGNREWL